jgi:hypothetical protein
LRLGVRETYYRSHRNSMRAARDSAVESDRVVGVHEWIAGDEPASRKRKQPQPVVAECRCAVLIPHLKRGIGVLIRPVEGGRLAAVACQESWRR